MSPDEVDHIITVFCQRVRESEQVDSVIGVPTSLARTTHCLSLMRKAMLTENWTLIAEAYALLEEDRLVMDQIYAQSVCGRGRMPIETA